MATASDEGSDISDSKGFAVDPKTDCPHVELINNTESLNIDMSQACGTCGHVGENWLCLSCSVVFCSRYVNAHMVDHNAAESSHSVALSFSDLSVWCYGCDSYITSPLLKGVLLAAALAKQ